MTDNKPFPVPAPSPKRIGKHTHYILWSNGVRHGVDLHSYPFKREHWKYFHPNMDDQNDQGLFENRLIGNN